MSFPQIRTVAQKLARLVGLRYASIEYANLFANVKEAIMVNKATSRKSTSTARKRTTSVTKAHVPTHEAIAVIRIV